jgi:hypothetical protein
MSTKLKAKKIVATVANAHAPKSQSRRVFGDFLKHDAFVITSSRMSLDATMRIANGKGDFKDWDTITNRLYAGSFMYHHYFKQNQDIVDVVNRAVDSVKLIMVRTLCIGADGFGMRPKELEYVLEALELFDTMTRSMTSQEVMLSYHNAGNYLDEVLKVNQEAIDKFHKQESFYNSQRMLLDLALEHQQYVVPLGSCPWAS